MLVGATLKKEEIAYWEPKLKANQIMRIFPNSDGTPPDWTDVRYDYCERVGAIPFISGKMNGNASKLEVCRKRLVEMPTVDKAGGWIHTLYITDHHEPEGDAKSDGSYSAEVFKRHFKAFWDMIEGLPSAVRKRIKAGPCMTKQWTENNSSRDYKDWDPGYGDIYTIDCYLNSWVGSGGDEPFTSYPDAKAWLAKIKAYRFDGKTPATTTDKRPRMFAELGAISPPWDTNGAARAAWYQAVYDELSTWTPANCGWVFLGIIFWNTQGTGGSSVKTIGTRRWFQFDRRHNSTPYTYTVIDPDTKKPKEVTDPIGGYLTITPTSNAAVLTKYNQLVTGASPPPPPDPGDGPTNSPQAITPAGIPSGNAFGAPTVTGGAAPPPPPTPTTPPPVVTPPPVIVTPGTPAVGPANLTGVAAFTLLITDGSLRPMLPPLVTWRSFEVTLKRNQVGAGQVVTTGHPRVLAAAATPNSRLVIIRNPIPALGIPGSVLASGPIEKPGPYGWSVDQDEDQGDGTATLSFATNEEYLAERLVYPNPGSDATSQGAAFYTATAINAETLMRQLVNLNAGPGAVTYRRVPGLALAATAAGVGTNVAYSGRFDVLTDALRFIAGAGGGLNFRVRDTGPNGQLIFEVYAPTTRPNVLFARSRGNLRALDVDPEAPVATAAIVGGAGTGASRTVYESRPATAWRRMETFVNQSGEATTAELQQAAAEALAEKGEKVGLTATAIDPWGQGFGVKYLLGDRVPVQLNTGIIRTDYVEAVKVSATAEGGATFTPTIGTTDAKTDPKTLQQIRDMNRRLRRLERS